MSRQAAFKQLMPIAYTVARKYQRKIPRHECTDDLVNVALMGVWEAVTRRYKDGTQAMTALAYIRANGSVADYLRTRDWTTRHSRKLGKETKMVYMEAYEEWTDVHKALLTRVTPEDEAAENQVNARKGKALEAALATLSARDRYVVRRLLAGVPQVTIAAELKVSEPRISQILFRVLPKLKSHVKASSMFGQLW
jgi:RNA polymerase sigma factor (sigma-70 family)